MAGCKERRLGLHVVRRKVSKVLMRKTDLLYFFK
jgi:hypothetical protein